MFGLPDYFAIVRRLRSINFQIIGVKMSCIASGIFPPGQTMVFALDMKLSSSMERRVGCRTATYRWINQLSPQQVRDLIARFGNSREKLEKAAQALQAKRWSHAKL
jgi:hypothetical protein